MGGFLCLLGLSLFEGLGSGGWRFRLRGLWCSVESLLSITGSLSKSL